MRGKARAYSVSASHSARVRLAAVTLFGTGLRTASTGLELDTVWFWSVVLECGSGVWFWSAVLESR